MPEKILIIGNCGSGKSTLARKIHQHSGLELIHLDQHYHRPGWTEPEVEVWREQVRELVQRPNWIMDGNYGGTFDLRFPEADMVILLEVPVIVSLWRVVKRVVRYHGKVRPDMPERCPERFSLSFLWYVAHYKFSRKPGILQRLKNLKSHQDVDRVRNKRQHDALLQRFANKVG
jgi:adenylate kinase family enzyme